MDDFVAALLTTVVGLITVPVAVFFIEVTAADGDYAGAPIWRVRKGGSRHPEATHRSPHNSTQ